jgi:hypothetical protein
MNPFTLLFMRPIRAGSVVIAAISIVAASEAIPPPSPWADVCAAALKASGAANDARTWHASGAGSVMGAHVNFDAVFDGEMRFRVATNGPLPLLFGFDGKTAWSGDLSGLAHPIILQSRDENELLLWTETGTWATPAAHFRATEIIRHRKVIVVNLTLEDGVGEGQIVLSADTMLPESLSCRGRRWYFADYKTFNGRQFPTQINSGATNGDFAIEFATVDPIAPQDASFAMPAPDSTNISFDETAADTLPLKNFSGVIFVKPKINGKDVGWFFLDTGADVSCIDSSVANRLGLEAVGAISATGVVAQSEDKIGRADSLQLGPMTLNHPALLEVDLSQFSEKLGAPIGGICGFDVIGRTPFKVDFDTNSLLVLRPGNAALSSMEWTPIEFDNNIPLVTCPFSAGAPGYFSLDTGSTSTIDFFSPAVRQYHLLDGPKQERSTTTGAGGSAVSFKGVIDWVDLGGRRFTKPTVGFQTTDKGLFSSPFRVGNIGMGLLGQFHSLVIDYANQRIAFGN